MTHEKPTEVDPMTVEVVEGEVVITGPDAIGVSITGPAAKESARRLDEAADHIAEQEKAGGAADDSAIPPEDR